MPSPRGLDGLGLDGHVLEVSLPLAVEAEAEADDQGEIAEAAPVEAGGEDDPVETTTIDQGPERNSVDDPENEIVEPEHGSEEIISYAKPKRMRYSFE